MSIKDRIGNLFGGNNNTTNASTPAAAPASAPAVAPAYNPPTSSAGKVILEKSKEALDKHIVDLSKRIDLTHHVANVVFVIDGSGSMSKLYRNGSVQNTITRLLPIALQFDDDGQAYTYVFTTKTTEYKPLTYNNFETYVDKVIGGCPGGCTSYAPTIEKIVQKFGGQSMPTFVIFITDGANDDRRLTDEWIRRSSKERIFFQFVGLGDESHDKEFEYLEKLDNLDGRAADNTAFVRVRDFEELKDDELFDLLLKQYPDWLRAMGLA